MERLPQLALALATGLTVMAPPGPATAQTCHVLDVSQTCLMRGVPSRDLRNPQTGGDVICKSYAGAPGKAQYDGYIMISGWPFYNCTIFRGCVWVSQNDPDNFEFLCK